MTLQQLAKDNEYVRYCMRQLNQIITQKIEREQDVMLSNLANENKTRKLNKDQKIELIEREQQNNKLILAQQEKELRKLEKLSESYYPEYQFKLIDDIEKLKMNISEERFQCKTQKRESQISGKSLNYLVNDKGFSEKGLKAQEIEAQQILTRRKNEKLMMQKEQLLKSVTDANKRLTFIDQKFVDACHQAEQYNLYMNKDLQNQINIESQKLKSIEDNIKIVKKNIQRDESKYQVIFAKIDDQMKQNDSKINEKELEIIQLRNQFLQITDQNRSENKQIEKLYIKSGDSRESKQKLEMQDNIFMQQQISPQSTNLIELENSNSKRSKVTTEKFKFGNDEDGQSEISTQKPISDLNSEKNGLNKIKQNMNMHSQDNSQVTSRKESFQQQQINQQPQIVEENYNEIKLNYQTNDHNLDQQVEQQQPKNEVKKKKKKMPNNLQKDSECMTEESGTQPQGNGFEQQQQLNKNNSQSNLQSEMQEEEKKQQQSNQEIQFRIENITKKDSQLQKQNEEQFNNEDHPKQQNVDLDDLINEYANNINNKNNDDDQDLTKQFNSNQKVDKDDQFDDLPIEEGYQQQFQEDNNNSYNQKSNKKGRLKEQVSQDQEYQIFDYKDKNQENEQQQQTQKTNNKNNKNDDFAFDEIDLNGDN